MFPRTFKDKRAELARDKEAKNFSFKNKKYKIGLLFTVSPLFYFFREESSESRLLQAIENDTIDQKYGFERVKSIQERTGFLINMHTVSWFFVKLNT